MALFCWSVLAMFTCFMPEIERKSICPIQFHQLDLSNSAWSMLTPHPDGAVSFCGAAVYIDSDNKAKVMVVGGQSSDTSFRNTARKYDIDTNSWHTAVAQVNTR